MCTSSPRRRAHGFSLYELIVALSIVAILFAILLPVLRSARESAQRSTSMSNLRQIYAGLALYSSDAGGIGSGYTSGLSLPPNLQVMAEAEHLPLNVFRSGCPSVRGPVMRDALFRQMWHFGSNTTQEDWLSYAARYQDDAVLVGDDNCDFRDRFFKNPYMAHRGIGLYEAGNVATIVRLGSTLPLEWWSLAAGQ